MRNSTALKTTAPQPLITQVAGTASAMLRGLTIRHYRDYDSGLLFHIPDKLVAVVRLTYGAGGYGLGPYRAIP